MHVSLAKAAAHGADGSAAEGRLLLRGELSALVDAEESTWQMADDDTLELCLSKAVGAQSAGRFGGGGWWPRVLCDDPEHDVSFCDAGETYVRVDKRAAGLAP